VTGGGDVGFLYSL